MCFSNIENCNVLIAVVLLYLVVYVLCKMWRSALQKGH